MLNANQKIVKKSLSMMPLSVLVLCLAMFVGSCQQSGTNQSGNQASIDQGENTSMVAAAETKESQADMTPDKSMEALKEGNERFVSQNMLEYDFISQVEATATGQYPHAVVLSCIDSRIPTEIVFDQGVGDIFNARVAGNFVNEDILGSMEFACKVAGSKLIVVMGHTSCGAVKGACDDVELGNLTQMLDKIEPAVNAVETPEGVERNSSNIEFVNDVAMKNVEFTIEDIRNNSPVLAEMLEAGEIDVVGAMYDVKTGKVEFY
jgi:carbonic anhydrase